MKTLRVAGLLLSLAVIGACGQSDNESKKFTDAIPSHIVANNYSGKGWNKGVLTKDNASNQFYFLVNSKATNPVRVGAKLKFAKSGVADVVKVEWTPQGKRIAVFVTVNRDLDPEGDGFPHRVLIK